LTLILNSSIPCYFLAITDNSGKVHRISVCPSNEKASFWLPKALKDIKDSNLKPLTNTIFVDGPGSFTGLRVGLSALRTISYLLRVKVKKISSLELMALLAPLNDGKFLANLDAQRNRSIFQKFEKQNRVLKKLVSEPQLVSNEVLQTDFINNDQWVYVGHWINENKKQLIKNSNHFLIPDNVSFTELIEHLENKKPIPWNELVPKYYRKSTPEEKRENMTT